VAAGVLASSLERQEIVAPGQKHLQKLIDRDAELLQRDVFLSLL